MSLPGRDRGSVWLNVPFAAGTTVTSVVATGAGELLCCSGSATTAVVVVGVDVSLRGFCEDDIFSDV